VLIPVKDSPEVYNVLSKPVREVGNVAHVRERRGQVHTGLWRENLECKKPLAGPRHIWKNNTKRNLNKLDGRARTELIWLRTETCGRL
jgi:hypothetical protein